jgi:uncharacterized membrane protein YtjA (UPF0391 family)
MFVEEPTMLRWAVIFLVLALVAGLFGFGGIASTSAGIARSLFMIFAAITIVTFVIGIFTTQKSR